MRKLMRFSGATVASPGGALLSVRQVKTSALHNYYITKMLLCYFAVCVHFAPAAAILRPVQAVGFGCWLPDWQRPYTHPSQCVCRKSLTSVTVHKILTHFVKWNSFFSFSTQGVGFTWVNSLCLPLITLTCMFYSWAVENYTAWHLLVFVPPCCRACFTV